MKYLKSAKIQLGETGWFLGDLSNLIAGSLSVSIYVCPECGKIELFQQNDYSDYNRDFSYDDQIAKKKCPNCGQLHDIDYPKCPFCKYKY